MSGAYRGIFLATGIALTILTSFLTANCCLAQNPVDLGGIESLVGEQWIHRYDPSEWCALIYVGPHADRDATFWDAGNKGYCCPQENAIATNWYAIHTGNGSVTLQAQSAANEPGNSPMATLNPDVQICGFSVFVELHTHGDISGDKKVHEGERAQRIAGGPTAWSAWTTASGSGHAQASGYIHVQVDFKTVPSHAEPRDAIRATVDYAPSAGFQTVVCDNDRFDTKPVALIKSARDLVDSYEGAVDGRWTFQSSTVGGKRRPPRPDFVQTSSAFLSAQLPMAAPFSFNGMDRSATLFMRKGQTSGATYSIEGTAAAKGGTAGKGNSGKIRFRWNPSTFTLSNVEYGCAN